MELLLSQHAKEQMIDRGFSKKEVEECLINGAKTIQNGKIISTYMDYRVVYKMINKTYFIITIMYRW